MGEMDVKWVGKSLEMLIEIKRQDYQLARELASHSRVIGIGSSSSNGNYGLETSLQKVYREFDVVSEDEFYTKRSEIGNGEGSNSLLEIELARSAREEFKIASPPPQDDPVALESTLISNGFRINEISFMESMIENDDDERAFFPFLETTEDHESYKQAIQVFISQPLSDDLNPNPDDNNNQNDAFIKTKSPQPLRQVLQGLYSPEPILSQQYTPQ